MDRHEPRVSREPRLAPGIGDTLTGVVRFGNLLMWLGALILVVGALVRFAPGLFSWFGNLPGDIRLEGENSRVFIPITSMVLVSVIATILFNVVGSFLRDR